MGCLLYTSHITCYLKILLEHLELRVFLFKRFPVLIHVIQHIFIDHALCQQTIKVAVIAVSYTHLIITDHEQHDDNHHREKHKIPQLTRKQQTYRLPVCSYSSRKISCKTHKQCIKFPVNLNIFSQTSRQRRCLRILYKLYRPYELYELFCTFA